VASNFWAEENLGKQHQRKVVLAVLKKLGVAPAAFEKALAEIQKDRPRGRAKLEILTDEEEKAFQDYRAGARDKKEIQEAVDSLKSDQRWSTRYTLWLEQQLPAPKKRRR